MFMSAGVVFLLLGILALSGSVVAGLGSGGYWGFPADWFNVIAAIALSVCGVSLLVLRKDEGNALDSVTLSSIGITPSGRIAERMKVPERIIGEKTGRSRSDFIPEVAVVKEVGTTKIGPVLAFRKEERVPVESLIRTASSLLEEQADRSISQA